jgi:glyoxylase I family protein
MVEVIGIDHIYIAVSDLTRSEVFYDRVFLNLSFRKNRFSIGDDPHIQYFNRHFGYVLRSARTQHAHNAYDSGLHHLCFRVNTAQDVLAAAKQLTTAGVNVDGPTAYPEYAPDYVAIFFKDLDGLRLEITNYRQERRDRHDNWDSLK